MQSKVEQATTAHNDKVRRAQDEVARQQQEVGRQAQLAVEEFKRIQEQVGKLVAAFDTYKQGERFRNQQIDDIKKVLETVAGTVKEATVKQTQVKGEIETLVSSKQAEINQ